MEHKTDILCMQETELQGGFDENLLSIPGYLLDLENNDVKKRVGI